MQAFQPQLRSQLQNRIAFHDLEHHATAMTRRGEDWSGSGPVTLIMLSIDSITPLIAALAVPIKVSSKFEALEERFHEERI